MKRSRADHGDGTEEEIMGQVGDIVSLVKARFQDNPEKYRICEDVLNSLTRCRMESGSGDLVEMKYLVWTLRKLMGGEPDLIAKLQSFLVEDLKVDEEDVRVRKEEAEAMEFMMKMWNKSGEDFFKSLSLCQSPTAEQRSGAEEASVEYHERFGYMLKKFTERQRWMKRMVDEEGQVVASVVVLYGYEGIQQVKVEPEKVLPMVRETLRTYREEARRRVLRSLYDAKKKMS